jgi:membrane protease YdiL (CAAX protease family)
MNGLEPPTLTPPLAAEPAQNATIAPAWHTILALLFMLTLSGLSYYSQGLTPVQPHSRVANYIAAIIIEWVVLAFIWFGLRLRKQRLHVLLGENWRGFKGTFRDVLIGIGFLITANIVLSLIGHLLRAKTNAAVRNLLPHGREEIAVYFLLTITAGICEEIIFRGYFQRQFSAWFKSATVGLVLQGIVFGASHGYQGAKLMLIIFVYGVMFGLLAHWRRNLRPGMFAHFLQDFGSGLAGRYLK